MGILTKKNGVYNGMITAEPTNHLQAGNQRKLGLNQQQLGNFMVTSYWFTVVDEVLVIDVAGR